MLNLLRSKKLKFIEKRQEAQNAYTFIFSREGIEFEAGQHFVFILPHDKADSRSVFRIFSISSAPAEEYIAITTRFFGEKSSSFKRAMMEMKAGDIITVRGPSPLSDVFKIKDQAANFIFIAGGIGITPFHSVLTQASLTGKQLNGELFYANSDADFIFSEELDSAVAGQDNFKINKIISPDRITTEHLKAAMSRQGENVIFKISGTKEFVKNYRELLRRELKIPRRQIKAYAYIGVFGSYNRSF
jgi:ferredoxin-NADP reductase